MFFCQKLSFKKYSISVTHFTQNVLLSFLLTFIHTTGFSVITHGRICMSLACRCIYLAVPLARRKEIQPPRLLKEYREFWLYWFHQKLWGGTHPYLYHCPTPFQTTFLCPPPNSLKKARSWTRGRGRAAVWMELHHSPLWKRCPRIRTPSPSCCGRLLRLTVNQ